MIDVVPQPAVEAYPMMGPLPTLLFAMTLAVGLPVLVIWLLYGRRDRRSSAHSRTK